MKINDHAEPLGGDQRNLGLHLPGVERPASTFRPSTRTFTAEDGTRRVRTTIARGAWIEQAAGPASAGERDEASADAVTAAFGAAFRPPAPPAGGGMWNLVGIGW
ncbi:hypothetical protein WEH80_38005 [Actinomycetes bacterium KLBMP 9759]